MSVVQKSWTSRQDVNALNCQSIKGMKGNQGDVLFPPSVRRWVLPVAFLTVVAFLFAVRSKFFDASSSSSSHSRSQNAEDLSLLPPLPRFAYFISGTKGDSARVKRLLQAVYHPRNRYLLHLDLEAPRDDRLELATFVQSEDALKTYGNVRVVGEADLVTEKGPTAMASTLHAVAIFLKEGGDWDWFINLSAADYPLMPQDDILHIFSYLMRDLNFIEHTSELGWREYQRARPIIVDPGLANLKRSNLLWAKERRTIPFAFKLFAGSEWVALTKSFLEFCIWGWDNLPRILLMYYTNYLASTEGYFHTVICNHRDYQNTTVNHNLRFQKWKTPPEQQPIPLSSDHFEEMVESGLPFARPFAADEPVLDQIDSVLLRRSKGQFSPGGWCRGTNNDPCVKHSITNAIKPTLSSLKLEKLLLKLLQAHDFRSNQCG